MKSSEGMSCIVTILRFPTVGREGFPGIHLWMYLCPWLDQRCTCTRQEV